MKVLHIATMDHGGAGIAARRIHEALLQQGVESHVLCRFKRSSAPDVTAVQPDMGLYRPSRNPLVRSAERILRRRGKCLTEVERYERQMAMLDRQYGAAFTLPISNFDLTQHPLVQQADVIHLHWVENFVDYPTFFAHVKKPIVWTFHDESVAFGGFHYTDEARRLAEPYASLETPLAQLKRNALATANNLHMVALCQQMEQFHRNRSLAPHLPVEIIYNGIRPDDFQVLDRRFCRQVLGVPEENRVVCFCASEINDKYKGISLLVAALEHLQLPDLTLLCVGEGPLPQTPVHTVGTGPISNPRLLSMAYSAADLYAMPSLQESFSQTSVEAMACGCPVVATPCGIIDELITDHNGVRCADFTAEALADGLRTALGRQYDRQAIREEVLARFNIALIAKQYLDLYRRCVS